MKNKKKKSSNLNLIHKVKLTKISKNGEIIVGEIKKQFSFKVKRFYYLNKLSYNKRGFHSHKKLNQLIICVNGKFRFIFKEHNKKKEITLKRNQALFVPNKIWREFYKIQKDSILLVLCDRIFEKEDYIY